VNVRTGRFRAENQPF